MINAEQSVLDFLKDDGPVVEQAPAEKVELLRADVSRYQGIVGTIHRKSSTKIIKLEIRRYLSKEEVGVVGDGISRYVREVEDFVHNMPLNFTTTANVRYSHPTFGHPGWGHFRRTPRNIYYFFYVDASIFAGEEAVLDVLADYFDENNALLVIHYQTELFLQDTQKQIMLMTTPASRYVKSATVWDLIESTPGLLLHDPRTGNLLGTDTPHVSTGAPFFPWTGARENGVWSFTTHGPRVAVTFHREDMRTDVSFYIEPVKPLAKWFLCYANTSIDVVYGVEFQRIVEMIKARDTERGWNLWEHQTYDLAVLLLKKRVLLSANVGTGKTRVFAAAMDILSNGNSGVFVEAGLLPEFQKEYQNFKGRQKAELAREMLAPPPNKPTLLTYSALNCDIQDPFLKKTIVENAEKERVRLIASLEKWLADPSKRYFRGQYKNVQDELDELKSQKSEAKLSDLFANWKFNFLGFDESHNLKKETSNRFKQCMSIQSRYRLGASGTITTGNPKDVFSQLKIILSSSDQPLRILVKTQTGLTYISYFQALSRFITRNRFGSKTIDQISDLRGWRQTIDPYVVYTDKNAPKVSKSHVFKKYVMVTQQIQPDKQQFLMFASNIKQFGEELGEYKITSDLDILARMRFLANISSAPQLPDVASRFDEPYTGMTEKQKKIVEIVDSEVSKDNQIVLFTEQNETATLMARLIEENNTSGAVVVNTAGLGVKARFEGIERFRKGGATVIVGTYKGLGRGYNLPQASAVILYELYWTIDVEEQAIGRVMRPQQQQTPRVYMVYNRGMIDDYQATQILRSRRRNSDIIINGTTSIQQAPILSYREVARNMLDYLDALPTKDPTFKLGEAIKHELAI